ncbi:MAG: hypothetical protein JKY41_00450 [Rhodobacteraceae bacterium]|nr:hypothetical protein [Paracoccaceae bacterium]
MQKWDVVRIYCDDLRTPHDKYCICICPERNWFYFINSEKPEFRKSRELAVSIESYEAVFLNRTSYVDTTTIQKFHSDQLNDCKSDNDRQCGPLLPAVRARIQVAVGSHNALNAAEVAAVLND